jgi:uncharacterized protein YdeI (YjbR/CyaY-like superfamily)
MSIDFSKLARRRNPIPQDVKNALEAQGLMEKYCARPAYQQNDYISWINRAKNPETRMKRLDQMLAELKLGGVYMNMKHRPSANK